MNIDYRPVVAVDFDGTVVKHEFPEIGAEVPHAVTVLRHLRTLGFHIILWTMRSGEHLEAAVEWYRDREIELFGVNTNPDQVEWTTSPKAYAQIYIDDAALGCPVTTPDLENERAYVDWKEVGKRFGLEI